MPASVIIPIWNGESVIVDCLAAVYANSGDQLREVIAVDNASPDRSAAIIQERFPQTRLLRQPVNLGFAGGVNVGLRAGRGDVLILLNQDCIVQPGWLDALLDVLAVNPRLGIAGCTILNADGSINHAGAQLRRPIALGQHFTDRGGDEPRAVDYVTGAAMAIRRAAWDTVGPFDADFYPAYYEEVDYCYRARHAGFEVAYVPAAEVQHLFSSREWQRDPIRSWATHQHSRYRFVCKHFAEAELAAFFDVEAREIEAEPSFEMNLARVLGARDTLRQLPGIVQRRQIELGDELTPDQVRLLQMGFTRISRQAFAAAERQARTDAYVPSRWLDADTAPAEQQVLTDRLRTIAQREQTILAQAFFTAEASAALRVLKRLASLLTGREHRLLTELNVLHAQRLEALEQLAQARYDSLQQRLDRRLAVLETLMDYDYR
jgi:GT2 family glycosyltransferase